MTFWEEEPYVIQKLLSPVVAQIQRRGKRKHRVVHTDKLMKVRDLERWTRPEPRTRGEGPINPERNGTRL